MLGQKARSKNWPRERKLILLPPSSLFYVDRRSLFYVRSQPRAGSMGTDKGSFFQKVRFVFLDLQISKKKIFQKTILSLKFKFPANNTLLLMAGNLNFKFRIAFWNIFFGDLKNTSHFLKKCHL